jgi:hypothetical protein
MSSRDLQSLAKIGKGTKRKKREINLLEIAEEMEDFYAVNNSLEKVAELVKLSPEMVRQFLKINDLDENAKELIRAGLISSVDIGYRLSKLTRKDQATLAKRIVDDRLSSDDVRSIIRFKMDNPRMNIQNVTKKLLESKDKKIYVAYLGIEEDVFERLVKKHKSRDCEKVILNLLRRFISPKHIVSFDLNGRVIFLKVSKEGLNKAREEAKLLKVPLKSLANALLRDYLAGV